MINDVSNKKFDKNEYIKQYREKNPEKIRAIMKKYYEKNKNKTNACNVCNCQIKGINLSQHYRTKKHISKLVEPHAFMLIPANVSKK